jgi:hypothetical protein
MQQRVAKKRLQQLPHPILVPHIFLQQHDLVLHICDREGIVAYLLSVHARSQPTPKSPATARRPAFRRTAYASGHRNAMERAADARSF